MLFNPKASGNQKSGFTLVEVLIAALILLIAVAGWMGAQQSSILNRGQSRTMTVAAELAQSMMEELSSNPAAVCKGQFSCTGGAVMYIGGREYLIDWDISGSSPAVEDPDAWEARGLGIIKVRVTWEYRGDLEVSLSRVFVN